MESPFRRKYVNSSFIKRRSIIHFGLFFSFVFLIFHTSKPNYQVHNFYGRQYSVNDTIIVYDTVFYFDTTYIYDTVWVPQKDYNISKQLEDFPILKKIILESKIKQDSIRKYIINPIDGYVFSADIYLSPSYSFHKFYDDPIFNEIAELNQLSVTSDISNSFGLGINYHRKTSAISSGLQIFSVRENFNFLASDYHLDTILSYNYYVQTNIRVDSMPILNIDTLIATGDSVYYYIKDTDYFMTLDSNLIENIDTSEIIFNDKANNRYTYIEIPVIYSYTIDRFNYSISPEIGIITSFFVNSKGKIVSLTNRKMSEDLRNQTIFADISLSLYAGMRFNYELTSRFNFFMTAFCRRNINSIYSNYPIISRFNTFGFNFGLRYKFLH
jgi:hypothetical protein